MTQLLSQGLEISLIGMGITFAALGLIVLVMVLLERTFRQEPSGSRQLAPRAVLKKVKAGDDEVAIAIGVAVATLLEQERDDTGLGATLAAGRGAWWSRGRGTRSGTSNFRGNARSSGR